VNVRITLEVPEDHCEIGVVRRVGRALLEHYRAATKDIDDVETVVGELCANVTRHGRSEVGRYRVILEHHDSHFVLVVADQGPGFDPQDLPTVGGTRPDTDGTERFGGLGLPLVRVLTDRLEIGPSGTRGMTVRAETILAQ